MEFKDIENIHKDVIVRVKDILNLKELLPYMEAYFTPMTIQGIRADMSNHGPSYATSHLFDSVKRKPPSFYRMLAALRHIGQDGVYKIYWTSLQKYLTNDQDKLGRVLSLIEAQFDELERNHDHGHNDGDDGDDRGGGGRSGGGGVQVRTSGKGASGYSGSGNQACGGSESDWDSNTKDRSSLSHSDKDNYHPPPQPPPASSSAAYRTAASRSPATGGRASPDNENINFTTNTVPSQLDPRYAGTPLSSLDAGIYSQLGKALEAYDSSGEPWLDHLIINGNLGISRKEQKRIGNEKKPGIELLDVLDTRKYTLKDLEDLFLRCNADEPLNILRQFGNRIIVDKQNVTENNLNMNISKNQDNEKDMNFESKSELKQNNEDGGSSNYSQTDISGPDSNASFTNNESSLSLDGDDIKGTQAIQPCGERDTENTAQELGRNSSNESPILNQDFVSVGLKPNQDSSDDHEECESRGNESPKGTRAVKVHEDPTGEQAQHEPGREAMKLQYDRIHQFDADPEALEQTSFIPVRQSNNDSSSTCEQAVNDQVTALSLQDCTQNEVNAGQRFGNNIPELSICQDSLDLPESGENQRTMSDERDGNIPNNLDSLNTNSNTSFEN